MPLQYWCKPEQPRSSGREYLILVMARRDSLMLVRIVIFFLFSCSFTLCLTSSSEYNGLDDMRNKELMIRPSGFTETFQSQIGSLISNTDYYRIEDFHVSNLLLTIDVEGNLNAVNRQTGELLWSLVGGKPLVGIHSNDKLGGRFMRTTPVPVHTNFETKSSSNIGESKYNIAYQDPASTQTRKNSSQRLGKWKDGITWIVEPCGDGTVFRFTGRNGIEKLPLSIKELVLNSPFSIDDQFVYTGSRSSGIVKVNARTGSIVESFGLDSAVCLPDFSESSNDDYFLSKVSSEDTCEDSENNAGYYSSHSENLNDQDGPFINLGRTIYELKIHSRNNTSWNITYVQWGPNNIHAGLNEKNFESKDDIYIQPFHDNSLLALDVSSKSVKWVSTLPSVTVAIFDVLSNAANENDYIILTHPLKDNIADSMDNESTYLDRTKEGSWYALSEHNYPSLVRSAPLAKYITNERWRVPAVFANEDLLEIAISGVHNTELMSQKSLQNYDINNGKLAIYHSATDAFVPTEKEYTYRNGERNLKNEYKEFIENINNNSPKSAFKGVSMTQLIIRAFENVIVALICLLIFFVLSRIGMFDYVIHREPRRLGPFEESPGLILSNHETEGRTLPLLEASECGSIETAGEFETDDVKRKRKRGSRGGKKNKKQENESYPQKTITSVRHDINRDELLVLSDEAVPVSQLNGDYSSSENVTRISNNLSITDVTLGFGSHGTMVFKGYFENRPVAVKRMLLDFYDVASHEINLLQESDDHSNVVRYFCSQIHNKFLYIALELCMASLEDIVEKKKDISINLEPREMLFQIANGVHHLHSLKIVHRDIKPQNILIAASTRKIKRPDNSLDTETNYRFLISDFGLCKKLDTDQSSFKGTTANAAGTSGWRAPELLLDTSPAYISTRIENKVRLTRSLDIFSTGCVFFYVLTGGYHPFGDRYIREGNIIKNEYDLSLLKNLKDSFTIKDLISSMIQKSPLLRPDINTVMKHPYFWSDERKLDFLLKVSDRFEVERRDLPSELLLKFETIAVEVLGPKGWFDKFDNMFIENLGKYRKYNTHKLMDLLRAIRNKYHHYHDMPEELLTKIGSLPSGFYWYFADKFPCLLLCVFKHTQKILHDDDLLSPFF
ncbi:hypothetical protein CANINC_003369 [Pichia inconspicua]|uniref:non-specific serine/threonine protein kinase n=1 Tax=Pichia inconspicua TaxID=52247 RepID=A0A4T0WYS5_9ASCO|nr:hypothetical protein CANINC_003369 [[Candida] inconspicua]